MYQQYIVPLFHLKQQSRSTSSKLRLGIEPMPFSPLDSLCCSASALLLLTCTAVDTADSNWASDLLKQLALPFSCFLHAKGWAEKGLSIG